MCVRAWVCRYGPALGLDGVQLLYRLERGITHARVTGLTFSPEGRVLGVATAHHTTHLYALDRIRFGRTAGGGTGVATGTASGGAGAGSGGTRSQQQQQQQQQQQLAFVVPPPASRALTWDAPGTGGVGVDPDAFAADPHNPFLPAAGEGSSPGRSTTPHSTSGGGASGGPAGGVKSLVSAALELSISDSLAQWRQRGGGAPAGAPKSGPAPVSLSAASRVKHLPPSAPVFTGGAAAEGAGGVSGADGAADGPVAAARGTACVVLPEGAVVVSQGLLHVFALSHTAGAPGVPPTLDAAPLEVWDVRRRRAWGEVRVGRVCVCACM
jgi:hypothetical protein